jgi:hypothetical protein
MNESKPSEEALFEAVSHLPTKRRGPCLTEACGGDVAFRERLEILLRAPDRAGNFMAESVAPALPRAADLHQFIGTPAYRIGSEHSTDKRCTILVLSHYAF